MNMGSNSRKAKPTRFSAYGRHARVSLAGIKLRIE